MDYLLLIGLNVILAAGLYIVLSMRLSRNMYEFGKTNFENQIRALVIDFYRESEGYLVKLEARIKEYKNLVQRAEGLAERLESYEPLSAQQLAATAKKKSKRTSAKTKTKPKSKPKPTAKSKNRKATKQTETRKTILPASEHTNPLPPIDDINDEVDLFAPDGSEASPAPTRQPKTPANQSLPEPFGVDDPPQRASTGSAQATNPALAGDQNPVSTDEPAVVRILGSIGRALSGTFTGSTPSSPEAKEPSFFEQKFNEAAQDEIVKEDRRQMQRQKSDPYGFSPEDIHDQVDLGNHQPRSGDTDGRSMKDDMDALTANINRILSAAGRSERAGQPPAPEGHPPDGNQSAAGHDAGMQGDRHDTVPAEFIDPAEAQSGEPDETPPEKNQGRIIEASEPVYQSVNMDSVRSEILAAGLSREETVMQLAETGLDTSGIAGLMGISEAEAGLIRQMYSGR